MSAETSRGEDIDSDGGTRAVSINVINININIRSTYIDIGNAENKHIAQDMLGPIQKADTATRTKDRWWTDWKWWIGIALASAACVGTWVGVVGI